jgi:hypothetical protein
VCGSCGVVDDQTTCSDGVWDMPAADETGTFTCGERISWLQTVAGGSKTETGARSQVATEFPEVCGSCGVVDYQTACSDVWDMPSVNKTGTFTCGQRIDWLQSVSGGSNTEEEAKNKVASEFPSICGPCGVPSDPSDPDAPSPSPDASALTVVTQNLFWWNLFGQRDGGEFFKVFKTYGPFDIFLFQECDDVARIRDGLGYESMEIIQGHFALALMYDSNRFQLLGNGFNVAGENRYDQYYGERGVVWARLEEAATGKIFFVASHHGPLPINTGGKFGGEDVANRLLNLVNTHKGDIDEVILGGDFNADVNSKTTNVLMMKLQLQESDWVDHLFTSVNSFDTTQTTIIDGTGSDHRGLKTVFW